MIGKVSWFLLSQDVSIAGGSFSEQVGLTLTRYIGTYTGYDIFFEKNVKYMKVVLAKNSLSWRM
jgi:hypothetical protein